MGAAGIVLVPIPSLSVAGSPLQRPAAAPPYLCQRLTGSLTLMHTWLSPVPTAQQWSPHYF